MISGNFELTMKEVNKLKNETSELKRSLEFIEELLEKKAGKINQYIKVLNSQRDLSI